MKAIILAAGRGRRMNSLTQNQPKCLLKVKGKPLIEWQIDAFRKNNVNEIALVTGYMREKLSHYGCEEFHNPNWSKTQMVQSLSCAAGWLEDGPCLVSYSDIFIEEIVSSLMNFCTELGSHTIQIG